MDDIAHWLDSIGLGEYAEGFAENDVNWDTLPVLNHDLPKEIGVKSVGHRVALLKAIQALSVANSATADRDARAPEGHGEAERRQLTVMFCDLVGSTALSARLDPEDMHGIIGAYQRCCAELIERHGGFVARYMGDGLLAYFGYPHAHEHDTERAVQAGLALADAVPKLATLADSPLRVRIGVATGTVVVGDLVGSGEAQERGVVGETPNLAARLQSIAEPDMVVIADETRRLLGNLFELKDLGSRSLKGIAGSTQAWAPCVRVVVAFNEAVKDESKIHSVVQTASG